MSDSNWGPITKSVTGLFAAVVICLILRIVWDWSASYTKNYLDEGRYTAEYSQDAQQKIQSTCVTADRIALSECIYEIVKSTQDAQRSEQDLSAQKDMANWAFWMLVFSALGSILTGVGIYFVRENLSEMRKSTAVSERSVAASLESMVVSRDLIHTQSRAVLSVESAKTFTGPLGVFLTVVLQNDGQTSVNGGIMSPVLHVTYSNNTQMKTVEKVQPIGAIAPTRTEENVFQFSETEMTGDWFNEMLTGKANLGVTMRIEWYDAFGNALEFHAGLMTDEKEVASQRRMGGMSPARKLLIATQTPSKIIKKSQQ